MQLWRFLCYLQFSILLVIYGFFGLTGEPGNYIHLFNDKLMHCGGYIVAGFSISFAFPFWKNSWRTLFLIGFSIGIEIGQHFLPPRTFDIYDIAANSIGVILGIIIIEFLQIKMAWLRKALWHGIRIHKA